MKIFSSLTRAACIACAALMCLLCFVGCGEKKEKVVIYTSIEDYCVDYMKDRLSEQFPQYNIVVEYKSTGDHAAALKAAGTDTDCDIFHNLEYAYSEQIASLGYFADLSDKADTTVFTDDSVQSKYYLPQGRSGGCVAINTARLEALGLAVPASYEDLLDLQYKGHISMPNPASSSTGYMFLLSLCNAWGEDAALAYFDELSKNILAFTSSGSGPAAALSTGEAAVALALTSDIVTHINDGAPLVILPSFEEGVPYTFYSQGVIKGKETRPAVQEVFDFMSTVLTHEICERYYPEKIFKDKDYTTESYPDNTVYADMSAENPGEYKAQLLKKWNH